MADRRLVAPSPIILLFGSPGTIGDPAIAGDGSSGFEVAEIGKAPVDADRETVENVTLCVSGSYARTHAVHERTGLRSSK